MRGSCSEGALSGGCLPSRATTNPLGGPSSAGSLEMAEMLGAEAFYGLPILCSLWSERKLPKRRGARGRGQHWSCASGESGKKRNCNLPPQLLFTIMSYLLPEGMLKMRLVCRTFNDVFLTYSVQETFAVSLPRSFMEPTVGFQTLSGLIKEREAVLRNKERSWSKWLSAYVVMWLRKEANNDTISKATVEGQALWVQLQRSRVLCRLAMEEWLGHLSDCRRAQYNIRRNWFNPTNLGCTLRTGVPPVFLPDGTLCINDPPDVVKFYAKRDRGLPLCEDALSHKTVSRKNDSLKDMWAPFEELAFPAYVCLMYYDPYVDALHISLASGTCTLWRVNSIGIEAAAHRTASEADFESSSHQLWRKTDLPCRSIPSRIEVVGNYTISSEFLACSVTMTRDGIKLEDYRWSEDEVMSKVRLFGEGANGDTSRIIVASCGRDVSASLLPRATAGDAHLTKEDVAVLNILQNQLSNASNSVNRPRAGPTRGEASANESHRPSATNSVDGINGGHNDVESGNNGGNIISIAGGPGNGAFELLVDDIEHEGVGTAASEVTANHLEGERGDRITDFRPSSITINSTERIDIKRHVFGVFNEQARLMCTVAITHEVAVFILTQSGCRTLGVNYSGGIHAASVLSSPVFKRCESPTAEHPCEEGDALFLCASQHNVLICQQKLYRRLEEVEILVIHQNHREAATSRGALRPSEQRYGTWYFLKGYSYHSPPMILRPLVEVSSLMLQAFVQPRPLLPEHLEWLSKRSNEGTCKVDCQRQREEHLPPYKSSWWCPQRDGHPYFHKPFVMFISKFVGYLLAGCDCTSGGYQEVSTDDREHFHSVPLLDGIAVKRLHPSAVALSPSHAFFVLGMENGSILMVSPSCRKCDQAKDGQGGCTTDAQVNGAHLIEQLDTISIPEGGEGYLASREAPQLLVAGEDLHEEGADEGESSSSSEDEAAHPRSQHPHTSHLYRTTIISNRVRGSARQKRNLRSFTPQQLFGCAFHEDPYISALQRCSSSILNSMERLEGEQRRHHPTPIHAVWIHAPRDCYRFSRKSGIWSMHLDDWKLTVLNRLYELTVYDLSMQSFVGKDNVKGSVVFAPLLTLSPYLSHPFLGVPMKDEEKWLCSKIRRRMRAETERTASGWEIVWHNGVLVVLGVSKGWRYSVFDFHARFSDPDVKNFSDPAPVAYSAKRDEYYESISGSQMLVPLDFGKKGTHKLALPRHFPLLRRDENMYLVRLSVRAVTLVFLCVALILVMLRIDGYITAPHWVAAAAYAPYALDVIANSFTDYDRYYIVRSDVPFYIRLFSDLLLYIVFPVVFTLRRDLYPRFNTPWIVLTIPLCVAIAMKSLPDIYINMHPGQRHWFAWVTTSRLLKALYEWLIISTIVLLALYFDGPSGRDPLAPKFHIALALTPVMLLILILKVKSAAAFVRTGNWRLYLTCLFPLLLLALQVMLFVGEFKDYYEYIGKPITTPKPSASQSLFILPFSVIVVAIYKGYTVASVLCR
ncbi:uncharacterized protein TEOVI_000137700 [Trypanosoma equiperdum]|uniref:F-box domain-containing protein n=2 Tax=Trypanozoon TaxID=39700 RepID=Q389D6_TRYB2|nr:hypothetical protein, conserved [Trypanosoma brucei brucei TREU927]EAN78584.1 hypothetical protein, conserved [Trypanosoma brucei brucei TREU927]SCU69808.1 hypothetical protein, conserved [Trypanosoma equiperdum]